MSTLNVATLQNSGGTGTAATLASINGGPISGARNRIINGDCRIDQRNAGAAVTVNAAALFFPVDRFAGFGQASDGIFTVQRSTTAPNGFTNSLLATVTTADTSLGATQEYGLVQYIEGFNIADLGWGAAGASAVTLSFWIRSSITGTHSGSVTNSSYTRSYVFSYSISSANTWEYKSITIPGDTAGTWLTDNSVGIRLRWSLGHGSTYTGAAGSWNGTFLGAATGSVNLIGTNGATFYLTGVQLEQGTVSSPFERRSYGHELALCQRYFEKSFDDGVAPSNGPNATSFSTTTGLSVFNAPHRQYFYSASYGNWNEVFFKVQKRANPTITVYGNNSGQPFFNAGTGVSQAWGSAFGASASNTGWSMSNEYSSGSALTMTWCHWTASSEL